MKKSKKQESGSKILIYDLETAPSLGYVWGKYDQNVIEFERDWYIMSFSYKWLGDKQAKVVALPDFSLYKKDPEDDRQLVLALWALFNEADILIAHNGDSFDQKKSTTRFIQHNLPPPEPYKTIDTLKVARRYFKFDSNKLDDLGKYLKVGRKAETGGYSLWRDCMRGSPKAWAKMKRYNKQDVELLEAVYLKLRPWMKQHHHAGIFTADFSCCPKCGSDDLQKRGKNHSLNAVFTRWQCQDCFGWSQSRDGSLIMKNVV